LPHRIVANNIASTTPFLRRRARRYFRQIGHFFAGLALGLIFAGILLLFVTGH
jgi:tetrahydromethanopterin S-methyltransferase subunit F